MESSRVFYGIRMFRSVTVLTVLRYGYHTAAIPIIRNNVFFPPLKLENVFFEYHFSVFYTICIAHLLQEC